MADEVVAAPAAEESVEAPAGAKPSMAEFIKAAQIADAKARAEEVDGKDTPTTADKGATPERGPDGKFLPVKEREKAQAKAAALEDKEKPDLAKTKAEPAKPGDGSLARARQLANEGKMDEAFKVAFGKAPDELLTSKQWQAFRHETRKTSQAIQAERDAVGNDRAQLQQAAQQLMPLVHARQAIENGDYESAIKLAFGIDVNEFQKRVLHSFHGKNPDTVAARQEAMRARQELEAFKLQLTQQTQQAQVEQRRTAIKSEIANACRESGNPMLEARADKAAFVERVFKVQARHFDARTQSTLPHLEAAEMAIDELAAEYRNEHGDDPPWANAAHSAATSVRSALSAASGPGRTPARPAARAATSLRQSEAAEASAPPQLKGEALMAYHIRLAQSADAAERASG